MLKTKMKILNMMIMKKSKKEIRKHQN